MLEAGEDFVLLDIRTTLDRKFWIEDRRCLTLDLNRLHDQWRQIPAGKKVVVIDLLGKRTTIATRFLFGKGYTDLFKVSGGMAQYFKDGHPVKVAH